MNNNRCFGYPSEEYGSQPVNQSYKKFVVPPKAKFYHYASIDAVKSMLQHDNQIYTMWASHLSFLNDSEEFDNGENLIFTVLEEYIQSSMCNAKKNDNVAFKKIVEKFLDAARKADKDISVDGEILFNRNIYILCFCMEGNSLNQWKYYGKESGIALEFNLKKCNFSGINCDSYDIPVNISPYKVIYKEDVKVSILKNMIDKAYQLFLNGDDDRERNLLHDLAKVYALCPLFKHKDFSDENECRLIFRPLYSPQGTEDVRTLTKYRNRGGILLPYMEIKIQTIEKCTEPVIKNIIIGPGENQELLYKSMRHFVIHTGVFDKYMKEDYSNVQDVLDSHIIKSDTPFRG